MKLKITQGEWKYVNRLGNSHVLTDRKNVAAISKSISDQSEERANAILISDAGNTYQKCGMLPSELLDERNRYKEAIDKIFESQDVYEFALQHLGEVEMNKVNQLTHP